MQIAEVLSDLTSLRVCGHEEALALVNASKSLSAAKDSDASITGKITKALPEDAEVDTDLRRANDIMELHHTVKVKHAHRLDDDIQQARSEVRELLEKLRQEQARKN
ncbi:MAG: hypothetical protein M1835_006179 [Candelina submexicana]|nr:MAG: hypothetical protein M1835_006179 [Candelina submexicana]